MSDRDLLLEIGTEEIPARYVEEILKSLEEVSRKAFFDNKIEYKELKVFSSPRRLVLMVSALNETQAHICEEVKGPAKSIAFTGGEPTKALLGFLNSKQKKLNDIIFKEINGVEYVFVSASLNSSKTENILPEILKNIILSIALPRSMRWSDFSIRFIRPIRWIIALYGDKVVDFAIENIKSGKMTRGHRTLANREFEVKNAGQYLSVLKDAFVIPTLNERKALILKQIDEIEKKQAVKILVDDELLNEVANLVEYPTAFLGNFDEKYLIMPPEVLITPMKDHQRYFPVYKNGKLHNSFVFVRNGDSYKIEMVKNGNERVLVARLEDAEFFFKEDLKTKLKTHSKRLGEIVFRDKLGTMSDKVERMTSICRLLSEELKLDSKNLLVACSLCKADLLTNMVNEFEELQGIMGREYALLEGYDRDICEGIGEQYLPRSAGDQIPKSSIGAILSVADKLDTLLSSFAVNVVPTGSADPFGLRRQATAVITIIEKKNWNIDLGVFLSKIVEMYAKFNSDTEGLTEKLVAFIKQRIRVQISENHGFEIADSVLSSKTSMKIAGIPQKIADAKKLIKNPKMAELKESFTRIRKLIAGKKTGEKVEESLLSTPEEKVLFKEAKRVIELNKNTASFDEMTIAFVDLIKPIQNFFENVMVMDKDEKIRQNRLNLLGGIDSVASDYLDIIAL